MSKAFSVLSWNVKHFKSDQDRTPRIADVLKSEDPDVIALYEITGKTVFNIFSEKIPGYHWHITEGMQTQKILVGVKSKFPAFFSQRTEFKSGNNYLRPGALVTLTINSENYSLLFLHLKSSHQPIGLGLRDDQLNHAFRLKRTLDKALPRNWNAHFIIVGDLNTMGMDYRPKQKRIDPSAELKKIDLIAGYRRHGMRRLTKTAPWTWWNGPDGKFDKADLDHVIASKHLSFTPQIKNCSSDGYGGKDVVVRGWVDFQTDAEAKDWINQYSDHCYLLFEVDIAKSESTRKSTSSN